MRARGIGKERNVVSLQYALQKGHFNPQYTTLLLENPRWRTLTCSLRKVHDDFATNLSRSQGFIYLQALFNHTIHKSIGCMETEEFWSPTWRLTFESWSPAQ